MNAAKRIPVSGLSEKKAVGAVIASLKDRIEEKGRGAFASLHEVDGVLHEEYSKEFLDSVHANDDAHALSELIDIAVTAIWGIASIMEVQSESGNREGS